MLLGAVAGILPKQSRAFLERILERSLGNCQGSNSSGLSQGQTWCPVETGARDVKKDAEAGSISPGHKGLSGGGCLLTLHKFCTPYEMVCKEIS